MVAWTWFAPARKAATVLATAMPKSLWQCTLDWNLDCVALSRRRKLASCVQESRLPRCRRRTTRSAPASMPLRRLFLGNQSLRGWHLQRKTPRLSRGLWRTSPCPRLLWRTCSRVFFSLHSICKSDTGIMRWMLSAPLFAQRRCRLLVPRAALQISAFKPCLAMSLRLPFRLQKPRQTQPR